MDVLLGFIVCVMDLACCNQHIILCKIFFIHLAVDFKLVYCFGFKLCTLLKYAYIKSDLNL